MTTELPTVSVVLPCYNTHAHLKQAIDSVRAQTFADIETIIVNDGSTDPDTLACLSKYQSEGVQVVHQKNRGLPAARNAGFSAARGEYVLPLDTDDWLEPDAVEKLMGALRRDRDATFAFCHIRMEGEGAGVLVKNYNFFEQLFLNQLPYCLMLRRSSWLSAGGYDEHMRRGYEDWEFNIRLGSRGLKAVVVPEPLFHYRISKSGMLLGVSNKAYAEIWRSIRRKHCEIYRFSSLFSLWRTWKQHPSAYPLWFYFFWLSAATLLPNRIFSGLFQTLRRYSQGRRLTESEAQKFDSASGKHAK